MTRITAIMTFIGVSLICVVSFADSKGTEVSVVNLEQSTFAIHAPMFDLCYIPEATMEVIPFYAPAVIGSECEGFTDDVYHPPLKDCFS